MEFFCGSSFWDSNSTWYTNSPHLTTCFDKTVLTWIPSVFLSLFSALEIYSMLKVQGRITPSVLGLLQQGLLVILIFLQIFDCLFTFWKIYDLQIKLYPADQVQPAVNAVTYGFALILLVLNKQRGIQSSGVLFIFWLLTTICSLPEFLSEFQNVRLIDLHTNKKIHSIITVIGYPIIVVEFILNSFADRAPTLSLDFDKRDKPEQLIEFGLRACPQRTSSFLNQFTFQWMYPLLWKGYRKPLEVFDLWDVNEEDKSYSVTQKVNKFWKPELEKVQKWNVSREIAKHECSSYQEKETKEEGARVVRKNFISILPALWKANYYTIVCSGVLLLVYDLLQFISPAVLSLLITHLGSGKTGESWKGYFYTCLLFINGTMVSLLFNYHTYLVILTGARLRIALTEIVYQKSLVMSNKSRKEFTVGEIVNIMSVDTQRFQDFMQYSHQIWSAPFQICLSLYFLWGYLGPATLSGVFVLVILIPVNAKMAKLLKLLRVELMKKKDERVQLISEILSGIKVLKLYAWEPSFEERVREIRQKELHILRRLACINALANFLSFMAPVLVSTATFATFVLMDEENILDAQNIFVTLTLLKIMQFPMEYLPVIIGQLVQTQVSLKRINKFLNADEINPDVISHYPEQENVVLKITDGTFTWEEATTTPTLRNINLNVKRGSLIAVVGTVGSGKSSLLSAILGEMELLSGRVNTFGSIAYVAQQPWIQNASLRDNILFRKEFDPVLYARTIEACALKPDIGILSGGDNTEIGEKGINLSGGQKQRVALARSVYNDADIYLLDDPLSAVDSHVGNHLFEQVLGPEGLLHRKTRIVVTHGISYLPYMDYIVVMNNGEIAESGTYTDLLQKKGALAEILTQHLVDSKIELPIMEMVKPEEKLPRKTSPNSHNLTGIPRNELKSSKTAILEQCKKSKNYNTFEGRPEKDQSKLVEVEKAETGNVKADVFAYFLKAMGFLFLVPCIAAFTLGHGVNIYSNFWLSRWSKVPAVNGTQDITARNLYLTVYCILGVVQSIALYVANITLFLGILKAAAVFHKDMLSRVLRSPMSFFEATPIGRIINRFSKDLDVPDTIIGQMLYYSITSLYEVVGVLIVISISMPIFIVVVVPVSFIYVAIQRFYAASSRQLRRLESVSRSPIVSHFNETLAGLPTIRAFKVERQFVARFEEQLDKNLMVYFPVICTNRWVAVLLELIGNIIVLFAALFAVLYNADEASTGLSISYALSITSTLNFLIKQSLEVETNIVAVERIKEYSDLPQEAAWYVPSQKPAMEWPQAGNIVFNKFEMRYRDNLDLVLQGISCNISPGEKVGIVGRTGAGKSSLTLGLFRILEAAGGSIVIDGKDISEIGLQDIRGRLTIIPQDSVLFGGTLRLNLDPSKKYSDDAVWHALELAHLKDFVSSLPGGLNTDVHGSGENFSVGQMQLVCLARALLRKSKILILDEATAAVDIHTDEFIQQTIRTEFEDCTVLTIAHRLITILDSDRVMVLDNGKIREFDHPESLLSDHSSFFYGIALDAGLL